MTKLRNVPGGEQMEQTSFLLLLQSVGLTVICRFWFNLVVVVVVIVIMIWFAFEVGLFFMTGGERRVYSTCLSRHVHIHSGNHLDNMYYN